MFRLDLDLYYDPLEPRDMGGDRVAKLGIISAQQCNLCLGDLARYGNMKCLFSIKVYFSLSGTESRSRKAQPPTTGGRGSTTPRLTTSR